MRIAADEKLLVNGFRNWRKAMQESSTSNANFGISFGNVTAMGMVHVTRKSAFDQRMGKQSKKMFTKVGGTLFEVQNIAKS
eukprot:5809356-Heterocapsa_arctica.AAC.1